VAHGLTCFTADGTTAEITSLNYGGFSKAVTGENAFGYLRVTFGLHGTFGVSGANRESGSAASRASLLVIIFLGIAFQLLFFQILFLFLLGLLHKCLANLYA
jgi:hypothetical protein